MANPVKKTMEVGGFEREYLVYTPSNPAAEKAVGIIVCLHGFGRTMEDFFDGYDITSIADSLNMMIISPQALEEQDPEVWKIAGYIDNKLSLHSVWGCGLNVRAVTTLLNFEILNEELNKEVDDVLFIDQIIDEVMSAYEVDDENLFVLGTSMGGYMTYQYALRSSKRLSGIISIAGSMGTKIKGIDNRPKAPVCDFHSITDEVVPYTGSYELSLPIFLKAKITLAMPKEEVINYWRETNSTGEPITEQIEYYPSTTGIAVTKITYPNPENEVIHYKTDGAPHSYFFSKENGDCMDHVEEIARFIQSHTIDNPAHNPIMPTQKAFFYPNPVADIIHTNVTNGTVTVYEITGKGIYSNSFTNSQVDLSFLKSGIYFIRVQSGNTMQTGKLIKK